MTPIDPFAKLAESGLDDDDVKLLNISVLADNESRELGHHELPSIYIPYFSAAGEPLDFYRLRYLDTPEPSSDFAKIATPKKFPKYVQKKKTPPRAYFPPPALNPDYAHLSWADIGNDPSIPIIITEGEFKSACATKYVMPTIGLGGVWSFRSKRFGYNMLPELEAFDWVGRRVYIIFDSDSSTNPQVEHARSVLYNEIVRMGGKPLIIDLPPLAEPAADEPTDEFEPIDPDSITVPKTGLDDYIMANKAGHPMATQTVENLLGLGERLHGPLDEFLRRFAFVSQTNAVADLVTGDLLPLDAFRNTYANEMLPPRNDKEKPQPLTRLWLSSPQRMTLRNMVNKPGMPRLVRDANGDTQTVDFNVWPGWGVKPRKPSTKTLPFDDLLAHLYPDPKDRNTILDWLAYPLQNPGYKLPTALLLVGGQGTGKSMLLQTVARIYGEGYRPLSFSEFEGGYTHWMEGGFVIWDEFSIGSHSRVNLYAKLKDAVTATKVTINRKFTPQYDVAACFNMAFTSNYMGELPLDPDDRRMIIMQSLAKPKPQVFYMRYVRWLESGGASELFYNLLQRDLENFQPGRAAPMNEAKEEMINLAHGDLFNWCVQLIKDPDSVLVTPQGEPLDWYLASAVDLANLFMQHNPGENVTGQWMGRILYKAGYKSVHPLWPKAVKVTTPKGTKVSKRLFLLREPPEGASAAKLYMSQCDVYGMANASQVH